MNTPPDVDSALVIVNKAELSVEVIAYVGVQE
jgi:hypothetical protein